jgi:hypothetical protein
MADDIVERNRDLWMLAASPAIWATHFLVSYATVAIWCAKLVDAGGPLAGSRAAIGVYSALALGAIAVIGWRAWKRHRLGGGEASRDRDSPADRYRFLGHATLLLSGLSAVAVIYATLAIVFVRDCR